MAGGKRASSTSLTPKAKRIKKSTEQFSLVSARGNADDVNIKGKDDEIRQLLY